MPGAWRRPKNTSVSCSRSRASYCVKAEKKYNLFGGLAALFFLGAIAAAVAKHEILATLALAGGILTLMASFWFGPDN